MIFIPPFTTKKLQRQRVGGPQYISTSAKDPGFALRRELEIDIDSAETASGTNYLTFTPKQRAWYLLCSASWWDLRMIDGRLLSQLIDTVEFALARGEPHIGRFALQFLDMFDWTPDQEAQRQRLISAILYAANGDRPGEALNFSPRVGLLPRHHLNAALSALLRHKRPADHVVAWSLVRELHKQHGENSSLLSDPKVPGLFEVGFKSLFPDGMPHIHFYSGLWLKTPNKLHRITHSSPQPYTAEYLSSRKPRIRMGWDFLAAPEQFDLLLEFAAHCTSEYSDFNSQVHAGRYAKLLEGNIR